MSRHERPARYWLQLVTDRQRLCRAAGAMSSDSLALLSAQARAAAAAGVSHIHLREPDLEAADLLALSSRVRGDAGPGVRVLVNDRVDVAVGAGVDAHLRTSSLPAARVRAWAPATLWLSRAVHSPSDAAVAGRVDAVLAGTVKATTSKPAATALLGFAGLAAVVQATSRPVIAIGGLTGADWPAVCAAGAAGIAAIGWFLPRPGEGPEAAVRRAGAEWADAVAGTS